MTIETKCSGTDGKKILPGNSKVSHVESELKKIMRNAPKRKVNIQVMRSKIYASSLKVGKDLDRKASSK